MIVLAVALSTVLVPTTTEDAQASTAPFFYRITNGETTEVLEALVDGRSAVEFYDYSSGDSSSHTGYEESETLSVFLWSGPEGKSLVFMADEANDGTGGDLTVEIAGLPDGAFWSVKDDPGDGYTSTSASWHWISCCTDGGVMDLATNDAIALNMTFPLVNGLTTFRLFGGPADDPQFVMFDPSKPLIIETFQTPGAPSLAGEAGPGAGELTLTATEPTDDGGDPVTSYNLYEVDGTTTTFVASNADGTFPLGGLPAGSTHTYVARAVNLGGEGDDSDPVTLTTFDVASAPQGLEATAGPGAGEISLSWEAPTDDGGTSVTDYVVYRDGQAIGTTSDLAFMDDQLDDGTNYDHTVAAVNLVGEGPLSESASTTTYDLPDAPGELHAAADTAPGAIHLDWSAPELDGGTPVTAYRIYRDGTHLTTTTQTSFSDTGLTDGTPYTYEVTALNLVGEGPGASAENTTADVPTAPQDLFVTSGSAIGTTELEWTHPANDNGSPVLHYTVYAGSSPGALEPVANTTATAYTDENDGPLPVPEARHYAISATNLVGEGPTTPVGCGVPHPYGVLQETLCG